MTQLSLSDEFLATQHAPTVAPRPAKASDFTQQVEVTGDKANATIRGEFGKVTEGDARAALEAKGLDPDEFTVSGFRSSVWTMANGEPGESVRYSFQRIAPSGEGSKLDLDELLAVACKTPEVTPERPQGDHAFVVAIGDMQFGKIDGDGAEGTLQRTIDYLKKAAAALYFARTQHRIGQVHIAWLGDHIEGFAAQGGALAWRTPLTLSEQIRMTRRVMMFAVEMFAPLTYELTVAAVPGNHGETVRFGRGGITRYDDSHDTEALIAVAEACAMNPERFGHVKFFTPEKDELNVVLDMAGTKIAHTHGHMFNPGKHFDWWEGQAFGSAGLQQADVLLAGHFHHEHIEARGKRLFLQVPSLESESTWFRHRKGITGNPGILTFVTKDGQVKTMEVVR